ncbi:MAG: 50S ribosomal protein L40e [Candidatus Iainarchaeum sp.]|jgi:ribosomal protein L40E
MAEFKEAMARRFNNVFVCQKCNATNRSGSGKPSKCRKCASQRLRLKKKKRKSS